MIKRHVDLSEAPGGAETRSHLTGRESLWPKSINLLREIFFFPPLLFSENLNAMGLWKTSFEEAVIGREVSEGECKILEDVLRG